MVQLYPVSSTTITIISRHSCVILIPKILMMLWIHWQEANGIVTHGIIVREGGFVAMLQSGGMHGKASLITILHLHLAFLIPIDTITVNVGKGTLLEV